MQLRPFLEIMPANTDRDDGRKVRTEQCNDLNVNKSPKCATAMSDFGRLGH